jgi:hypothetical protein
VSRACIDVKSDGNITRALPLLSSGLNVGVSSWHCLAGSPNGAAGTAFGVILVNFIAPLCTAAKKLGHPICQGPWLGQ